MRKLLVMVALIIGTSALVMAGGPRPAAPAQGQELKHERACSMANVAGAYGVYGGGTILPGNQVGAPPGPYATIGRAELDGHGAFIITSQTGSFNGAIFKNITAQGVYTVNADCTGTLAIGSDTADIVFANGGNEFYATDTTSGIITTFVFKRITPEK